MNQRKIILLDEPTINKIAAGEVIERPASVVKELVENSLDADAKRIELDIEDGGLALIRVSDDGCGMSAEDVRMSVLRHATSKISRAEDIFVISSLGFRGEALPSIASVSQFSLFSRFHTSDFGTQLQIEGGRMSDISEAGGSTGTIVTIKNLFYNTPARLKFMKSASTESSHILDILLRISLTRPDVSFILRNGNKVTLQTPGTGLLKDALAAVYGIQVSKELCEITYAGDSLSINGFISKPTIRKGSRQWQTLSVNGRVIASRSLNKAIDLSYQHTLPHGNYPVVYLDVRINPDQVDVNVHPQKSEVRFQDEKSLFRAVQGAIGQALSKIESPAEVATQFNYATEFSTVRRTVQEGLVFKSGDSAQLNHDSQNTPKIESGNVPVSDGLSDIKVVTAQESSVKRKEISTLIPLEQISGLYILASDGNSLFVIDQHAAHERIIFDKLSGTQDQSGRQLLLIPDLIDLDPLEVSFVEENELLLNELGFLFDWVGPGTLRLLEIPLSLPPNDASVLFREALDASLQLKNPSPAILRREWIHSTACHMAVRAGQSLNLPMMQKLISDLMQSPHPFTCPHGRPVIIQMTADDFARLFRRT